MNLARRPLRLDAAATGEYDGGVAEITVAQAFNHAVGLAGAGRVPEAEAIYRQILAVDPKHVDAMQMLGVLMAQGGQGGRWEEGLDLVQKASRINPAAASCHVNIGMILAGRGKLQEAIQSFRHALRLRPGSPEAQNNLANALMAVGRIDDAIDAYQKVISLHPRFPHAHNNLGTALCARERADEAIECFRRAIALKPDYAEAHFNLGKALYEKREWEAAMEAAERALSLRAEYPEALTLKGVLLQSLGHHGVAVATYERSLAVRPGDAETLNNLATAHLELRRYDLAIQTYQKAIAADPGNAEAQGNLGRALGEVGHLDEAIAQYRKSLQIKPQSRTASGMLLYLHLHTEISPREILEEHKKWASIYVKPKAGKREHPNSRDPDRRIRVGYVSPDFTNHPVGRFMHPILSHHDRERYDVVCYSDTRATDAMTARLRGHANLWRDTSRLSDAQLAKQVREDRVDVLVDLVMHSKGSRLLAFAEKSAPVQLTYLAYASTTGIAEMDYRISDPYLDPTGRDESAYTEKTLRLPHSFWCYEPAVEAPEVAPLPASVNGYVTFGCLNNYWKVTPPVLELWTQLLARLPGSRLVLHAHEGDHRRRVREKLAEKHLHPERVSFVGFQPLPEYLRQHTLLDIALDPFPYCGGTTTCEALWMGTPVFTLPGQTAVSRAGMSILSNVGLPELVARSKEEYLEIASHFATDLGRLAEVRSTLRDRMRASPLMDAPRFARDLECLYRNAWKSWCEP
jgi:predicted O-linked N-acetylglucosamine transferase (SPINDLY family)